MINDSFLDLQYLRKCISGGLCAPMIAEVINIAHTRAITFVNMQYAQLYQL